MTPGPLAGATGRGVVEIPDSRAASPNGDPDGGMTARGLDEGMIAGTTAEMTDAPQRLQPRF